MDEATKAPERIWADAEIGDGGFWACDADEYEQGDSSAYIRKDLYDALAKERDELVADSAAAWDKCEERRLAQKKAEAEVERLKRELDDLKSFCKGISINIGKALL